MGLFNARLSYCGWRGWSLTGHPFKQGLHCRDDGTGTQRCCSDHRAISRRVEDQCDLLPELPKEFLLDAVFVCHDETESFVVASAFSHRVADRDDQLHLVAVRAEGWFQDSLELLGDCIFETEIGRAHV